VCGLPIALVMPRDACDVLDGHAARRFSDENARRSFGRRAVVGVLGVLLFVVGAGAAGAEDVPADFAGRTNPSAGNAQAAERGKELFLENCSPCHGDNGDGRGPAAVGLTPPPANLASPELVPRLSDGYLFYRLTQGKRGSAMPAFNHSLSEDERWAIVTYLRGLAGGQAKR
jgi:mono/diheme cytochrome c family protein